MVLVISVQVHNGRASAKTGATYSSRLLLHDGFPGFMFGPLSTLASRLMALSGHAARQQHHASSRPRATDC